jgi:hypothetical protein
MYSPKFDVKTLRSTAQTLTGSWADLAESGAASINTAVKGALINQLALFVNYTANAGATNPILNVRVQYGLDGANDLTAPTVWYTEQTELSFAVVSGVGQSTVGDRSYLVTGNTAATVYKIINVPVAAKWAKLQVLETQTGGAGTVTGGFVYGQS